MGIVGTAAVKPGYPKVSGGLNGRTYTIVYLVQTDSKSTGPLAVINAPGIPLLYSEYSFNAEHDPYALMRTIDAERSEDGSFQWDVTCEFSTPEPNESNRTGTDTAGAKREVPGQQNNPEIQLPELDVTFERFQIPVYAVYDTTWQELTPCKASNDQVFDPPPTKDAARMIITIVRNESLSDAKLVAAVAYNDAVNSDRTIFGLAPGQCKIQILPQRQTKQVTIAGVPVILPYLRITYKIECKPTWDTLILDAGTFFIDSMTGKKRAFLTDDGHPRVGALDGGGGKLADGALPVFKTFRFYQRLPYSVLNLPQGFADFA